MSLLAHNLHEKNSFAYSSDVLGGYHVEGRLFAAYISGVMAVSYLPGKQLKQLVCNRRQNAPRVIIPHV